MTVYFIRRIDDSAELIKIGHTADLEDRIANMRVASPGGFEVLLTLDGGVELERYLHGTLRSSHFEGEWFRPTSEVLDHIDRFRRMGLSALPAGALGQVVPRRRSIGGREADVLEAQRLVRLIASRLPATDRVKNVQWEIQKLTGFSARRARSIWEGAAHQIEAWEMQLLREVTCEVIEPNDVISARLSALKRHVTTILDALSVSDFPLVSGAEIPQRVTN